MVNLVLLIHKEIVLKDTNMMDINVSVFHMLNANKGSQSKMENVFKRKLQHVQMVFLMEATVFQSKKEIVHMVIIGMVFLV